MWRRVGPGKMFAVGFWLICGIQFLVGPPCHCMAETLYISAEWVTLKTFVPPESSLVNDGNLSTSWTADVSSSTANMSAAFVQPAPVTNFTLFFDNRPPSSLQVRLIGTDATWVVNINQTCSDTFYHWRNNNELRQCVSVQSGQTSVEVSTPQNIFWVVNKTNGALLWSMNFTGVVITIDGDVGGFSNSSNFFSLAELEIFAFKDDPSRSGSCRCDPTGLVSVSQPCNTTGTDTGRCLCRPQPSYPSSNYSRSCRPYIQPIKDFTPYYGPRSGGTLVQFNGSFLSNVYSIMIGGRYPCIPYASRDNDDVLQCLTTAANQSDIGKPMPFHICWSPDTYLSCLITVDEFTYRPEPTVTSISRPSSMAKGGLSITINGVNFDSVYGYFDQPAVPQPSYMPYVTIHVDQNLKVNTFYDLNETARLPNPCIVRSNTQIICKTPVLDGYVGPDVINSWKSITTNIKLQLHLGTGFYNNKTLDLDFMVYVDPTFDVYGPVKDFNVYKGDTIMTITGQNLLGDTSTSNYITKEDYTVTVGGVPCTINTVVSNAISYSPPPQEPVDSLSVQDGAHQVVVKVGYYLWTAGSLKYVTKKPINADVQLIAGIVGGVGGFLVLVLVLVIIVCYRRRRRNQRPPIGGTANPYTFADQHYRPLIDDIDDDEARDIVIRALVDSNRLQLANELGKGNFGQVYRGVYEDINSAKLDVAVKVAHSDNMRAKIEFLMEAVMMAEFQHPNVLTLLAIIVDGLTPYVVLPLMHNGDLRTFIMKPSNTFLLRDLIEFARQVAEGMDYLSPKLVHRDLAARNCMVDRNMLVKVADFGLARFTIEKDYYLTRTRERPLPFKWLALESMDNDNPVFTTKSDVWSFGILMYELMTRGGKPYQDIEPTNLRRRLRSGYRLEQPSCTPDDVYRLMLSCWDANPSSRPSFRELADYLQSRLDSDEGVDRSSKMSVDEAAAYRPRNSEATLRGSGVPEMRHMQPSGQANPYIQLRQSMPSAYVQDDGYLRTDVM